MKSIFVLIIFLLAGSLNAQDTIYLNSSNKEVRSIKSADRYKVLTYDDEDQNKVIEQIYLLTGQILISEMHYSDYDKNILNGKLKTWYKSGQIRRDIDYKDGKINGKLFTYWENGQKRRHDKFNENTLIEGRVWDSLGNEVDYFNFEEPPEFPGGEDVFFEYLRKNIKYPPKARRKNIQGQVIIGFVVETDGRITKVEVKKSVHKLLDKEALRVVKNMPMWIPGKQDGEKVRVAVNLPISFKVRD